jgi:hypothetical protein
MEKIANNTMFSNMTSEQTTAFAQGKFSLVYSSIQSSLLKLYCKSIAIRLKQMMLGVSQRIIYKMIMMPPWVSQNMCRIMIMSTCKLLVHNGVSIHHEYGLMTIVATCRWQGTCNCNSTPQHPGCKTTPNYRQEWYMKPLTWYMLCYEAYFWTQYYVFTIECNLFF